jgi:hypothetical protein
VETPPQTKLLYVLSPCKHTKNLLVYDFWHNTTKNEEYRFLAATKINQNGVDCKRAIIQEKRQSPALAAVAATITFPPFPAHACFSRVSPAPGTRLATINYEGRGIAVLLLYFRYELNPFQSTAFCIMYNTPGFGLKTTTIQLFDHWQHLKSPRTHKTVNYVSGVNICTVFDVLV